MDQERVTRFLTAIGDPMRLQIIFEIRGDRLTVNEIAARFRISRPAISHHLKILRDAGVVRAEKVGQEVYHWVDKQRIVDELRGLADEVALFIDSD